MPARIDFDITGAIEEIRPKVQLGLHRGGEIVLNRALEHILNDPKTGRIYTRRGVTHQASAPGEAPASDTGQLIASGSVDDVPEQLMTLVSFNTDYAEALELGTQRIAARPYLRISLDESIQDITEAIREALE